MTTTTPTTGADASNGEALSGAEVARRLRESGALDELLAKVTAGSVPVTGADGLLP